MKQDRFLLGIVIGIGVLAVLALGLFFMRQNTQVYLTTNTPEAVVHNYVLALTNREYEKSYGYLADLDNKPTYAQFRQSFFNNVVNPESVGVDVGAAEINADEATVTITLMYSSNDPFSSNYNNSDHAQLVKQNGEWKLSSMPYNFWDYNWYQSIPKP
jgi:hypothetical protein